MIRLNKKTTYLIGFVFIIFLYLTGQLLFFINTKKADGRICSIESFTKRYTADVFYLCFTTDQGELVRKRIGSDLGYKQGRMFSVVYKTGYPRMARLNSFKSLWVIPFLYYLIPLGFIMAFITGIFYGHRYISISKRPFKVWLSKSG